MSYTIAGMKVLNEHLALGVFAAYGALGYAATAGGDKKTKSSAASKPTPPIGAASSDEESFIKQFLAEAEGKGEKLV